MSGTNPRSDDERLITALRAASEGMLDPTTIEERIGLEALVNTSTGLPLEALRRVDLRPDPDHPDETLALDEAAAVIYWARPIPSGEPGESGDPRVVGLRLDANGRATVFFAVVSPP